MPPRGGFDHAGWLVSTARRHYLLVKAAWAKGTIAQIVKGPLTKLLTGKGPVPVPGTGRNRPLADSN